MGCVALLIFGVRRPIKGCFRAGAMLLRNIGEDCLRLRPMGIVDGACALGVKRIFLRLGSRVVIEDRQRRLRTKSRRPRRQGKKKHCEQQRFRIHLDGNPFRCFGSALGVNPGAQDANVKEKAVGIHLLPKPGELRLAQVFRLVCEFDQQTLQMVE